MKKKIWIFYGILIVCLCISPLPVIGAYCINDRLAYPICFMALLYTWLLVSIIGRKWINNNFYMDLDFVKNIDEEELKESILESKPLNFSDRSDAKAV